MESKKERRLTDQEAYDLLREEGFPENANELTDYRLPAFDTWGRYLRQARGLTGEQKYTRRRGRPVGKSIVKSEQIERQKDDNE
jgi:hypothetical protein